MNFAHHSFQSYNGYRTLLLLTKMFYGPLYLKKKPEFVVEV